MVYPYKITSKEDLITLCKLACKEDFPVYISTSYGQLDARSLLGLFTVLGKDVNLVAPDHLPAEEFIRFINKLRNN